MLIWLLLQVYLDDSDKPEIGEELNRAAEVTLHKIYKVDKTTNRPSTDPADFEKYERKLKKLSASQGARYISYEGRSGTWVFEVEHFSRCVSCHKGPKNTFEFC